MYVSELISKYLDTYDFSEILELNDTTEEEVLEFLVEQEFIQLPQPAPVDL